MKKNIFIQFKLFIFLISLAIGSSVFGQDEKTAYEIWNDMTESAINYHDRRTLVNGTEAVEKTDDAGKVIKNAGQMVMFGGEKEGSSALITRIMGPDKNSFKSYINSLSSSTKENFLRTFLTDFTNGKIRMKKVFDTEGNIVPFDLDGFKGVNFSSLSSSDLEAKFDLYLERGGDKHFSHIKKQTRMNIFNGKYGGVTRNDGIKAKMKDWSSGIRYSSFKPLHGKATKFITAAHGTSVGWEINFNPQRSYGEFEGMVNWFREELKNVGKRFEAPGHQWVVYPKTKAVKESTEKAAEVIDKIGEIQKNIQAYIVLKSVEGNAGIELSSYKSVQPDDALREWHSTGRGVVRLENGRFKVDGNDSFAIEFRAGVKSDKNRRMTQKFLVSRYAANEFDDIASAKSWDLSISSHTKDSLMRRFNVSGLEAKRFLDVISGTSVVKGGGTYRSSRSISQSYLVPLWQWENAPYLSDNKKIELRRLTRSYIKSVAGMKDPQMDNIRKAMSDWAKISRVSHDIEAYLKPKQKVKNPKIAHVFKMKKNSAVDVNKIDYGIEYSARFPLKTSAEFEEVPGQIKKFEWQKTYYDYSTAERKKVIREFAETLGKKLNDGIAVPVKELVQDGHGHGLDIAFEVKDKEGRKWRAEWDGIGRNYDLNSKMIAESVRGGHVEIVTPKFVPSYEDKLKLFSAMKEENLVPQTRFGGGHVNIDLAPFEGKPKKMARFLGAYLDNRNVMSMMFQHPGRQIGAEAFDVSPRVISELKNFNGSEEDLKKFLYNEKFYNTRVGRKTKNSQLNLTAYFQDVIPEKYIHEDFDMKNDLWRKTFDVEPKIRKMEFRMFNAPRNQIESALQIKFTKALLNKALNESDEVFKNSPKVDYEKMYRNPEFAFAEFEKTMKDLNLDPAEYKGFLIEGLEDTKNMVDSPRYVPISERLKMHPKATGWDAAVAARETPISSEGRTWSGDEILPEARVYAQKQMVAREAAERTRSFSDPNKRLNRLNDKLPLDLTLDLDEIKKLDDSDALVALYYQKNKIVKNSPYKKYFNSIVTSKKFKKNLPSIISDSEKYSDGFKRFVTSELPKKYRKKIIKEYDYNKIYKAMLTQRDPSQRARARKFLMGSPNGVTILLDVADVVEGDAQVVRREIMQDIASSKKSFRKDSVNIDTINRILAKSNDPATIRGVLKVSKNIDDVDKIDIFKKIATSSDLKLKKMAHNYLKRNAPLDFYFEARNNLIRSSIDPRYKAELKKYVQSTDLFDRITAADIAILDDDKKLVSAYNAYHSPNVSSGKKSAITRVVNSIDNIKVYGSVLKSSIGDLALKKWAAEKFEKSDLFKKLKTKESISDSDDLLNLLSSMIHTEDEELSRKAFKLADGFSDKKVKLRVQQMALNFPRNEKVSLELYDELIKKKEFRKSIEADGMVDLAMISHRDVTLDPKSDFYNKNRQTKAFQLMSIQVKEGNSSAKANLINLVSSENPRAKKMGYILYGSNPSVETIKDLPRLLGGELSSIDKKFIKRGVAKHKEFISNMTFDDIKDLKISEQIRLMYEKSKVGSIDDIIKNLPIENKYFDTIRDEFSRALGRNKSKNLEYRRWLLNLTQQENMYAAARNSKSSVTELAKVAFLETSADFSNNVKKLLDSVGLDFMTLLKDRDVSDRLIYLSDVYPDDSLKVLKLLDKDPKILEKIGHGLGNIDTDEYLKSIVKSFVREKNSAKKTQYAKILKKIKGDAFDEAIRFHSNIVAGKFRTGDAPKVSRHLALLAKGRNSENSLKSLKLLQKSSDPMTKRIATEGIKSYLKKAKGIRKLDGLSTSQKLSLIYQKSLQVKGSINYEPLLKQIADPDNIIDFIRADWNPKANKWLIDLVSDSKNAKALGLNKEHLSEIVKTGLKQGGDPKKASLSFLRSKSSIPVAEKIGIITNLSYSEIDADALDTLKVFASKKPKDKRFVSVLKTAMIDSYLPSSSGVKVYKKATELMMMLPTNSIEQIVKYADYYLSNDKRKAFVLLGAAKHDSAVVADYAKKNLESDNPSMRKVASKVSERWNKKSKASKLINRSKCIGRSVRNVLSRLTFR